jgi:hypothetical protein
MKPKVLSPEDLAADFFKVKRRKRPNVERGHYASRVAQAFSVEAQQTPAFLEESCRCQGRAVSLFAKPQFP